MQEAYRATGETYLREDYRVGNYQVQLDFNGERNWVKIDVWALGFPDWVYNFFWAENRAEFHKKTTRRSDSISAENPAVVMARVNSLHRKSQNDYAKTMILADLRKQVVHLKDSGRVPEETIKEWNMQAKEQGLFGPHGLLGMNMKQVKILRAWFDAKVDSLAPKKRQEALAGSIVGVLLDDEEPEEDEGEFTVSPAELTRAIGLNYADDEFIFDERQDRFAGRWPTGTWSMSVHWKKLLRKGQPVYLGSIRRVERPYNNQYSPVAHEGMWYIDSVPTKTRAFTPRGARMKPGAETKHYKTHGGYGAVRYREMPVTYTKYFRTRAEAAGYLASLIVPHRHLKVVENQVGDFVEYLRKAHLLPPTDKDFVYRDASNPNTRHLDLEDDYRVFNVYAKRAARGGKIPFIGQIVVYHLESGKPAWSVNAVYGMNWPGEQIVDKQHPSRLAAATVLWQFFANRMGLDKPVIP